MSKQTPTDAVKGLTGAITRIVEKGTLNAYAAGLRDVAAMIAEASDDVAAAGGKFTFDANGRAAASLVLGELNTQIMAKMKAVDVAVETIDNEE